MRLFYGNGPCPFHMSATRHYTPEELQRRAELLAKNRQLLFLQVENNLHPVELAEIPFAAVIAASYHNQISYNAPLDDGWAAETHVMEKNARENMVNEDCDE